MKGLIIFSALAHLASASYSCIDFKVPLSFTAEHMPTTFPPFENHYESVAFLNNLTARNSAAYPSPVGEPTNISVSVTIAAQYCTPAGKSPKNVQVLTHGIGFDHTYWDFGGSDSQYNYIKAATAAGYATLSYDRMGAGKSTIKNPYNVQQVGPETQVLTHLTTLLRNGGLSKPAGRKISVPSKVAHVGHSYGSRITAALASTAPSLSDAIVLTGWSTDGVGQPEFAISTDYHIANQNQKRLGGHESNGWLTWGDELANQYSFFHYPAFSPDVLAQAEKGKWPFAIGGSLTGAPTKTPEWSGPLLILAGEYDRVFCGADCTGVLHQAKAYFPNASPFKTYVQPNIGHGINLHYNATGAYHVINDFVTANI